MKFGENEKKKLHVSNRYTYVLFSKLKMHQTPPHFSLVFQKFPRGACPQTPLVGLRTFGACTRAFGTGAQKLEFFN